MKSPAQKIAFVCLSAVLAALPACSGKSSASKEDLQYVAANLMNSAHDTEKAAATVEELKRYGSPKEANYESAMAKINSGEIVVVWGYSLPGIHKAPGGPAEHVIVYEKDAPTKGGYVVTGDLNAKKVTADEFKKLKLAPTAAK